jgi:recombination protein RecT
VNDKTTKPEIPENPEDAQGARFPALLKMYESEIARALPKHMTPDRMTRIALTAFKQTPALKDCDPITVFAAVVQSAQLGLEVGLMGEAYLVPFNKGFGASRTKECQLIPGYQGLMKLARNSGLITDIYAMEVREKDDFDVVYGLDRKLHHEPLKVHGFPASDEQRGPITGFYAVAKFKDGTKTFEIMSVPEVNAIRDESQAYKYAMEKKKTDTPWIKHYVPMGRKSVIRKLCKNLPKSPELANAITLDDLANMNRPQNIASVITGGEWEMPLRDVEEEEPPAKPELTDAAFAKKLEKEWKPALKSRVRTLDELFAMIATKNSLTEGQVNAIREAAMAVGVQEVPNPVTGEKMQVVDIDPTAKAPDDEVAELVRRAGEAGLSTADIDKFLDLKPPFIYTYELLWKAQRFINDPVGEVERKAKAAKK